MQENNIETERKPTDDHPTDGEMAQKHGEEMQQQEKAEGDDDDTEVANGSAWRREPR